MKVTIKPFCYIVISNNCLKYAPKWMVSSLIFQKFSGEGLTEPPPQTPPPAFSRASPSVRASPSILGRFAPSTRASPSILGRFAPSIRASPSTFDWGPWFGPPKINSWIRPWLIGLRSRVTIAYFLKAVFIKFTINYIVILNLFAVLDGRIFAMGYKRIQPEWCGHKRAGSMASGYCDKEQVGYTNVAFMSWEWR